jgi:hypothetical protein
MLPLARDGEADIGDTAGATDGEADIGATDGGEDIGGRGLLRE